MTDLGGHDPVRLAVFGPGSDGDSREVRGRGIDARPIPAAVAGLGLAAGGRVGRAQEAGLIAAVDVGLPGEDQVTARRALGEAQLAMAHLRAEADKASGGSGERPRGGGKKRHGNSRWEGGKGAEGRVGGGAGAGRSRVASMIGVY